MYRNTVWFTDSVAGDYEKTYPFGYPVMQALVMGVRLSPNDRVYEKN